MSDRNPRESAEEHGGMVGDTYMDEVDVAQSQAQAGEILDKNPPTFPATMPSISVKPGWQTSQGQMTFIFSALGLVLSMMLGRKVTSEHIQTAWEAIGYIIGAVGALVAVWRQLQAYTNSRGMIYSNSLWATASMNNPLVKNDNIAGDSALGAVSTMKSSFDFGSLLGGSTKDPRTYINLAQIIGSIAGGRTGRIIDKVTGPMSGNTTQTEFQQQVEQAFTVVAQRFDEQDKKYDLIMGQLTALNDGMKRLTNSRQLDK